MKRLNVFLCAPVALAVAAIGANGCASRSSGGASASVSATYTSSSGYYDDYYSSLDQYGTWVEVSAYGGEVWCPLDVSAGWRPYTVGSWAYTDYGWMWVAADPWGDVPYHYGRWAFDSYYGWVWVPGDVWGPAWVSWRYGDGWAGWAPLPPDVGWQVGIGLSLSGSALDARIDPYSWCFVPARDITSPNLQVRLAPPSRNVTYINITQNVTNYTVINSRPAEHGLRPEVIERDTGRRISPYRVVESDTPRGRRRAEVRGQTVQIPRPDESIGSNVRDRARTQAPDRAMPRRQLMQRQEAERTRFDQRMKVERDQLTREQQREMREPPRGISREELTRRHNAELQAQQEREDRERKAIDERTRRFKERGNGRGQQDNSRGRDQEERGRGRGNGG